MQRWCHNLNEMIEVLALVSTCAPDDFPQDEGDEPLDLERAVDDLHYGLNCSVDEIGNQAKVESFRSLINAAHGLYRSGQINEGTWKLQELEQHLERL